MTFKELLKLYVEGTNESCVQQGNSVLSWRETAIGLVKKVEEVGTGKVHHLQLVGSDNIVYPPH